MNRQIITVQLIAHVLSLSVSKGCTGPGASSTMSLKCPDSHKLYILRITMGRSHCYYHPKCCPDTTYCIVDATTDHLEYVRRSCDGKDTCFINLINLRCGHIKRFTDYESVHYSCNNPGELILYWAALPRLFYVTNHTHLLLNSRCICGNKTSSQMHST